jgi:hypothetical protein
VIYKSIELTVRLPRGVCSGPQARFFLIFFLRNVTMIRLYVFVPRSVRHILIYFECWKYFRCLATQLDIGVICRHSWFSQTVVNALLPASDISGSTHDINAISTALFMFSGVADSMRYQDQLPMPNRTGNTTWRTFVLRYAYFELHISCTWNIYEMSDA